MPGLIHVSGHLQSHLNTIECSSTIWNDHQGYIMPWGCTIDHQYQPPVCCIHENSDATEHGHTQLHNCEFSNPQIFFQLLSAPRSGSFSRKIFLSNHFLSSVFSLKHMKVLFLMDYYATEFLRQD